MGRLPVRSVCTAVPKPVIHSAYWIFVLNRMIAQADWKVTRRPLIMERPAWSAELPNDASPNKAVIRMQDIDAPQCEYFCRELQAAYLAGQVLEYSHFDDEEKHGIDRDELMAQLTRLLNTLFTKASGSWRPSCGAIAMVIVLVPKYRVFKLINSWN